MQDFFVYITLFDSHIILEDRKCPYLNYKKTGAALWEEYGSFLKKVRLELPYDPAISLLGIYPEERKILIRKEACTPMFIAALFTIAKK